MYIFRGLVSALCIGFVISLRDNNESHVYLRRILCLSIVLRLNRHIHEPKTYTCTWASHSTTTHAWFHRGLSSQIRVTRIERFPTTFPLKKTTLVRVTQVLFMVIKVINTIKLSNGWHFPICSNNRFYPWELRFSNF